MELTAAEFLALNPVPGLVYKALRTPCGSVLLREAGAKSAAPNYWLGKCGRAFRDDFIGKCRGRARVI